MRAFLESSPIRAILAVPLIVKEQVIGALGLVDASGRVFTEDDVRLAQAFADQAAVALENARLYADAERRRVEAETLSGLVRTITATLDPASVLRRVAAAARELCGSDSSHILLRDAETDTMFTRYGVGQAVGDADAPRIARGRGAGGQAWSTGRPFRTANRPNDPRVRDDYPEAIKRERVIATLVVPIWISGQIEGLLYVSNRADRSFTDRDEAILIRLADHAAIAIQNATLYSRLQGLSGAADGGAGGGAPPPGPRAPRRDRPAPHRAAPHPRRARAAVGRAGGRGSARPRRWCRSCSSGSARSRSTCGRASWTTWACCPRCSTTSSGT